MNKGILEISSLIKALNSLIAAYEKYLKDQSDEFVRDSVIQRFEYTYTLALKMMQRYIKLTSIQNDSDIVIFKVLIRSSLEAQIISSDMKTWEIFRLRRNTTSHTYDINKALLVIETIPDFIEEIKFLVEKLGVND